jgi:hypothetical protein
MPFFQTIKFFLIINKIKFYFFKLKAKKTKMRNVKLQHKWGHNKKTRLRDFSQLQKLRHQNQNKNTRLRDFSR